MKGMGSAKEYYTPPPKGKYPGQITVAEAGFSKKGESHIVVTVELKDGPGKGETNMKWIGTDGTTKYGAAGKSFLRGLGVNVDSDAEVSDEQLCQQLLGQNIYVEIDHEAQMEKDENGEYNKPRVYFDPRTGQSIPLMRWTIKGFQTVNTGQQAQGYSAPQAQAPQQAAPAQQYPAQPAQAQFPPVPQDQPNFAPAGAVAPQGAPQGYAPAMQGQPPPQGYPGAAPGAPQGYAPPPFAPQGQPNFAPPPGFAPGQVAQPGWIQPAQQAQQRAPAEEPAKGRGRGRAKISE